MPDPTHDATPPDPPSQPSVPVAEAARYRQQALAAQQQAQALRRELEASRQTISALERRQRIDALLAESDTIDLEAARLLTEVAVAGMDEPDLKLAVDDLRRQRPYLFGAGRITTSTLAPHEDDPPHAQDHAADQAARTGDRRALLDYLRMRRGKRRA
jgi:hypothetical protein